ncbi:cardiac-enriched FHL2-interacting protein isoform X1 [Bufo gargarizans]|uniref:cardiac-enriched FHL2-interacting protein isoform X1 n=1 Tax=Bufo gargarizans TaxID=30331 RepID=UPI001CF4869F|nr:cardiac-enriched FHL2-interacting protein isoform X1 [Bufo gargarizans]XP_044152624.1 cardiac-enriched FHL2-interacting protein isoform X1 [Bufo gargarizans]XP_044152625.1 cardiac-enriched FHL2-interacting protein isoform X1 [Bufo gargarizans]
MLRYKKHKRQADGLGTSVTLMDDTDREVSSFTDRAFRSLCVAEEDLFNDVPHLPSPIRGMPLSTKFHLGIFNLSVRKTQPLAQLPTTTHQRNKWVPTFQPMLNYAKVGFTDVKTNNSILCAPVPRGYKQHSKVSSLIKTFDNIENEIPDNCPLPTLLNFSKASQRDIEASPINETVEKNDTSGALLLEPINSDVSNFNESHLHRRTARDVFMESQMEIYTQISRSPSLSSGSPLADQVKQVIKQTDSLRRTAFLHSEHSAFKSWSDINRKMIGDYESDSSIPGTPLIPRRATPCSPLLQRTIAGMKARDGGMELGWTSPASSVSSSFDANQMLKTVPPLPNRKNTKLNKDYSLKQARPPLHARPQDLMKVYEGHSSTTEQVNWINKSKSPDQHSHEYQPIHGAQLSNASQSFVKQNEKGEANIAVTQQTEISQTKSKGEVKELEKNKPPPRRIKTLIQQIEKEAIKEMVPVHFIDKKHTIRDLPKDGSNDVLATLEKSPQISNTLSIINDHIPPWRKTKSSNKIVSDKKIPSTSMVTGEIIVAQPHETVFVCKDDNILEEKPSSFNISHLLTPVISRKNIYEALEENIIITSPITIKNIDQEDQTDIGLYKKRDDYKSKATSLLFNLKDMRKRVKSTYNPVTTARNGFEKTLVTDIKIQEGVAHLSEINELVYENESSNQTHLAEHLGPTEEVQIKSDVAGNEYENRLCLSPMDQGTVFQNGEIPKDKVMSDCKCMLIENAASVCLTTNDNDIKKKIDYSSLNVYCKTDTYVSGGHTECNQDSLACLKKTEVNTSPKRENPTEDNKDDEHVDVLSNPCVCDLEKIMVNDLKQSEQCFPFKVNQWAVDRDENEKQIVKEDETKNILQYFAVNSSKGVDVIESKRMSEVLEDQIEKDDQVKLTDEKLRAKNICDEEVLRPSSLTPFKPNLFHLKDNKIKFSPVTKSVKLPLFRSLSEDCLVFKKLEDSNFPWRIGDLRETKESNGISADILCIKNMEIDKVTQHRKQLIVSPTSESPKQEAIKYNQIKSQKAEADDHTLNENNITNAEKKKHRSRNKTEESDGIKMKYSSGGNNLCLEESFFHPVETCVSECNALIVHNASEYLKEIINGEPIGCPCNEAENTKYSPIDNEHLQFEDSVSFAQDIACSSITSPMSESLTCSIVASPMSINTQSSGFTTALSALEDMPSPPSTSSNTRNGKSSLLLPVVIPTDSEPKTTYLAKQEKESFLESQKINAKPPAVPPKTEKALRRAKRLTKKHRKTEIPQSVQESNFQESDNLDLSPLGNVTPGQFTPQSYHKLMPYISSSLEHEDIVSESSTPSFPLTQRKILQDPDSGQYFMVDIPVCLRIKTFYDPETGRYLQMSVPSSERESPELEVSNSPLMRYPRVTPVPVSSIASFKGKSKLLNNNNVNTCERKHLWNDKVEDSFKMHDFIHCDSHDQTMTGTPVSIDRITSRSPDIISMKDIDDFAMEAVS